jgi:putative nucleotidyltransferase with HDIG domain
MVKTADWEVEFVGSRKESYRTDSRKPTVSPGTLADDQNRRDFTINALAISINKNTFGQFVDPFGGLDDISNQLIKTPLAPDITFSDDPLRMLRAIRFASQLGFTILPETFEAIQRNAERIKIISYERISEELNKILLSPKPSVGLKLLFESGLLKLVFKELQNMHGVEVKNGKAHKDNFYHTIHVVDNICEETNNLWLRWAALLHDIGKPATKRFIEAEGGWKFHGHEDKGSRMVPSIFNNLKLPQNEKMRYVQKLVALHHRPKALAEDGVTDSAIRRLIVDAGDDLEDLFTLCRADMTTRFAEKIALYKSNLNKVQQLVKEVEERDELRNWQPPITGEMIMETFHLQPCKEVGLIKNQIREAILDGKIKNDYTEAFAYMKTIAAELGIG